MGGKSTRKGKTGELDVAHILREHGYPVERGGTQSYGKLPDLYGLKNCHIEVKRAENARIWSCWLTLYERAEEIETVAARFPGASVEQVQEIVRSGLDHGFSFEAALVGARLAYAMQTGQEELFSLDDVAAALGCAKEEAAAEMEQHGIQGMTISTLPGFEWLLDKM